MLTTDEKEIYKSQLKKQILRILKDDLKISSIDDINKKISEWGHNIGSF